METMSPQQQENMTQVRSASLTGESKIYSNVDNKRRMKSMSHRRQSAPSLVISKALTRSRTLSRENCLSPVSPETCLLVQSYLSPTRSFITHAYVQLKTGLQTQERHLFLFSDVLLIAKAKSPTNFKLKVQVRVCEMWTAGCMEVVCEGSTSPEKSFVMGWPTCNCVATFCTVEQKEKWLSLIKSRIKEEKEKDNPKTIPLKVYAKDTGNCSHAKILAVSNSDCATEVIRLALQQFGISGCAKDYQLWVSSKKDNAPYPLIGHEFPFSIQMSHIREPLTHIVVKDTVTPPDNQGEQLIQQLQSDTQCQFILKPSKVVVDQPFVDPLQKPFKRRRSLINWAFWRGSTPQLNDPPPLLFLPTSGRLFGLPLSSLCKDNTLPKPIMDMLVFLYQEGPFTRGIFRRSAGAKACRELRDRLDTGAEDIQLTHESIFIIAAVFKDFLRNIPGSLLSSELYEQWMNAMDWNSEAKENQLDAIQRLVGRLPPENALLLKHVLAVLHNIQLRAHDNQMNSFNLAVCIAPSMLSAPAPSSPEMEGESTKKICDLVRLMIEKCQSVFGEDVTTLFDGFPKRRNADEHGSDISSYQMTDSSYDSLENELNDESGSPFQAVQRSRGKPDTRSRDSVITLSDCDLDQPDTDPETRLSTVLLLPTLTHPIKSSPVMRPSSPRPRSPCEFIRPSQGVRRLRRCSEPSIRISTSSLTKFPERCTDRKGSYDAAATRDRKDDIDEVFSKHLNTLRLEKQTGLGERGRGDRNSDITRQGRDLPKPSQLHLDASCSSLYSPTASPTRSSMSSLDSAFSQHSADFAKSPCNPVGNPRASGNASPCSLGQVSPQAPGPMVSPKESPPKDTFDWNQLRSSHGLHPNTWLKRDRRLSLTKDKVDIDDDNIGCPSDPALQSEVSSKVNQNKEKRSQGPTDPMPRKRSVSPPSYQQALLLNQAPYYTASEKPLTVRELRELHNQACSMHKATGGRKYIQKGKGDNSQLPQSMFFGQKARCLALYRQKSHSVLTAVEGTGHRTMALRRASEPGGACLGLDRETTLRLERLHRQVIGKDTELLHNDGLKVSDVDPDTKGTEPRFCLSPAATKAVRDYFTWHADEDPQSTLKKSQDVTMAIIHDKHEWLKRCSDPRLEDFDQLFFAEESYV
ncbi:rho GTPase-activating protein 20-like [Chanos chanos]|uniref:Rho GTPase-activating protein 20 n=1 Tax=Chanos chanos TaxID=29144 RepID=A0A6J2VXP4_CHACN|nr:rho GTPase-activating protein 20-like [Chanos chanos]